MPEFTEHPARPRPALAVVVSIISAVLLVVATVIVCGFVLLVVGLGTSGGYSEPTTAAGWVQEVARAANTTAKGAMWCAIGLSVTGVIAVVAARVRRPGWMWVGVATSGLFAIALLIVCVTGSGNVNTLAARAAEGVGNAPAIAPPVATPLATPTPFTADDSRAGITEMVNTSFDAAVGPVTDASGSTLSPDSIAPIATACGETGSQLSLSVAFKTQDNARSLAQILHAWDTAGYAPDRAMQEDIRYSESLPIARMSIRDRTTIDGLIHMNLTTRCAVAG